MTFDMDAFVCCIVSLTYAIALLGVDERYEQSVQETVLATMMQDDAYYTQGWDGESPLDIDLDGATITAVPIKQNATDGSGGGNGTVDKFMLYLRIHGDERLLEKLAQIAQDSILSKVRMHTTIK